MTIDVIYIIFTSQQLVLVFVQSASFHVSRSQQILLGIFGDYCSPTMSINAQKKNIT